MIDADDSICAHLMLRRNEGNCNILGIILQRYDDEFQKVFDYRSTRFQCMDQRAESSK